MVAETPVAIEIILPALQNHFDLLLSHTLKDALQNIGKGCDIVLCGLHFDESQMFELLFKLKENNTTKMIPFIALNTKNSVLPDSVIRLAAKAVISMGGDGFIDLPQWRKVLGDEKAFTRFRAHLHLL